MADPEAEKNIDTELVRALLRSADDPGIRRLADQPISILANGWDNASFRVGPDLLARLPRRTVAVPLIELEQHWLDPLCAGRDLGCGVPIPIYKGRPTELYDWPWSVVPFFEGVAVGEALESGLSQDQAFGLGQGLVRFMAQFHSVATADAPVSPYRGMPLHQRYETTLVALSKLEEFFDHEPIEVLVEVWKLATAATPWTGRPVWIHGDLHPWNMVWHEGRLNAVIDFGDMTPGDPATDLSIGWRLFDHGQRQRFNDHAASMGMISDEAMLLRACGWALSLATMVATAATIGSGLHRSALQTLERIVDAARTDLIPTG